MQIYCSRCTKHNDNASPKQKQTNKQTKIVMIANIKIKGASRFAECLALRLFSDKIKDKDEL